MYIGGVVPDVGRAPIAAARIDIWHSDKEGFYDLQKLDDAHGLAGRGRFT